MGMDRFVLPKRILGTWGRGAAVSRVVVARRSEREDSTVEVVVRERMSMIRRPAFVRRSGSVKTGGEEERRIGVQVLVKKCLAMEIAWSFEEVGTSLDFVTASWAALVRGFVIVMVFGFGILLL